MSGDGVGWERVAEVASEAFLRRGYAAVSLKQLGDSLGMKPASFYHWCPGGKAELYVRALGAHFERYRAELDAVASGHAFPDAFFEMGLWMLEHPPVDLGRIIDVDVPAVAKAEPTLADEVPALIHAAVFHPFRQLLEDAVGAGDLPRALDVDVAAASTLALVSGLGAMHAGPAGGPPDATTRALVRGGLKLLFGGMQKTPRGERLR